MLDFDYLSVNMIRNRNGQTIHREAYLDLRDLRSIEYGEQEVEVIVKVVGVLIEEALQRCAEAEDKAEGGPF